MPKTVSFVQNVQGRNVHVYGAKRPGDETSTYLHVYISDWLPWLMGPFSVFTVFVSVSSCFWCGRLNYLSSFSAYGKIGNFIIIIITCIGRIVQGRIVQGDETSRGRNVQEAKRPGRGRNVLGVKRRGGETSSYRQRARWLARSYYTCRWSVIATKLWIPSFVWNNGFAWTDRPIDNKQLRQVCSRFAILRE